MYKKYTKNLGVRYRHIHKLLLLMRLTTLLIIATMMQVSASSFAQKVSLSERRTPLAKVFKKITQQTGYGFFVTGSMLQDTKPVTIEVKNGQLEDVLKTIFKGQPVSFSIEDKSIIVKEKKPAADKAGISATVPITVTGRVTDTTGMALSGATLKVKGQAITIITASDGTFSFKARPGDEVSVSFVGFRPFKFTVKDNLPFQNIVLHTVNSNLESVTVVSTGYQTISAARASGSFFVLDSALVNRSVGSDALSRLEGVVPGLIFNHNTGASTGSVPDINIRGHTTLFSNDQPLIVVDNFPYDGDLNNINPNDIASISVLKDAAAASIWGVRSGNGVIVITSKKGRRNQPMQVELNTNFTIGQKPDVKYNPNFLDANNFIDMERQVFNTGYYDNALSTGYQVVSPVVQLLADARSGKISNDAANKQIDALRNNDVRNDISRYFYHPSALQQYNLNFKGGGAKSDYYSSVGFDKSASSLVGNNNQRLTVNNNFNFYPAKGLQLSAGLFFTQSNAASNNTLSDMLAVGSVSNIYPYAKLADANGNALAITHNFPLRFSDNARSQGLLDWYYRPLDELRNADNSASNMDIRVNTGLKYSFLRLFSAQINYLYETANNDFSDLYNQDSYYTRNLINQYAQIGTGGAVTNPIPFGSILQQGNSKLISNHLRGQLNYRQEWQNKHSITALLGSEWSSNVSNSYSPPPAYGYNPDTKTFYPGIDYSTYFPKNPADLGSGQIPNNASFDKRTDRFVSYFANAAYTYADKYVLTGSARIDKSNLFGVNANQKAIPLFSTGASWELSKETFYKLDWLPYAKLKVTYGYNGNINKTATAVTTLTQASNSYYTGVPYNLVANPGNPNLRWEKDRIINFALEFGTRNGVITGSIEPYFKKGEDLYGIETLAPSSGFKLFYGNTAGTSGHGIDITINSRNINSPGFKWTTNFIYSYVTDKVTQYGYAQTASAYLDNGGGNIAGVTPLVGAPAFAIYSLKAGPLTHDSGSPQGYLNGKLSTDYATILDALTINDLVYNGPSRPTHFGSLRNNFNVGAFSLSFNIIYKLGYYFRRSSINYSSLYTNWTGNTDFAKRWQKPGDELTTAVPSMQIPPVDDNRETFYAYSEGLVDNGSHIRLQDLNLSYDLTKSLWKNSPFTSLSVYGYVNNIGILWRANHDHLDPDVYTNGSFTTLPTPRTYSIGLKTNFK